MTTTTLKNLVEKYYITVHTLTYILYIHTYIHVEVLVDTLYIYILNVSKKSIRGNFAYYFQFWQVTTS